MLPNLGPAFRFIDGLPSMLWTFLAALILAYMLAIALTSLVGSDLAPHLTVGWAENTAVSSALGQFIVNRQGLVNVPFWEYWTSPYSSHYRPYT